MNVRYVAAPKSTFTTDDGYTLQLLWGDPVHVLGETGDGVRAYARGRQGVLPAADLGDTSLLELYIIDVGQGDGILIKTPDGSWHLVDAGVANAKQPVRKGVVNFLRWKFEEDLRRKCITLANVILSHPDDDHFGGLTDLFGGRIFSPGLGRDREFKLEVGAFYHNGIGRYAAAPKLGATSPGAVAGFPAGRHGIAPNGEFITELLDGKASFANPARPFNEGFAQLAAGVAKHAQRVARLSAADEYLPGYAPGQNEVTIRVLGPILESFAADRCGLRDLGTTSQTVNGHSIVLRLDYGAARILLTGDSNKQGQQLLLSYQPSEEFAADVAKGCHHGSEDVNLDFLKAVRARTLVLSSGDNESYCHPRPVMVGAAGRYGRDCKLGNGEVIPPLVYSTELARSVTLAYAAEARLRTGDQSPAQYENLDVAAVQVRPARREGGNGGVQAYRSLRSISFAADLVYGLVNIRTDGRQILCATMNEQNSTFDIKRFVAGA
jgi:hypothetical protein